MLAFEQVLVETYQDVEAFSKQSDGLIGPIGLDAILGMVPVLGGLYSTYGAFKLLGSAARAKCSASTRLTGFALTGIDIIVGIAIGVGDLIDAFLRSHAIYAGMIRDEIRAKLIAIETTREIGREQGYLTASDAARLEDTLFRGGKSQGFTRFRTFLFLGVAALLLYSCVS